MNLLAIQKRIAASLTGYEALGGAEVVVEDQGDLDSRLRAAIGRTGCCILVQTPGFRVTSSASKTMVGIATVVVQAMESVPTGRAKCGRTAQDLAEAAAWRLNMLHVEGVGVLVAKEISSKMLDDDRTLAYAVRLEVQTTLADPLDNGKEEAV